MEAIFFMRIETSAILLIFAALLPAIAMAQSSKSNMLTVRHIATDFDIKSLDDPAWDAAKKITVTTYWSGAEAPEGRRFQARVLWSDAALYVRFEADQTEPLVISEKPDLTKKVRGLWDRDVCEIFIAPNTSESNKYFEFEIAPTGEWIDLGIEVTPQERLTDWNYTSNMRSAALIKHGEVVMAIRIPFASLGRPPKAGDVWLGNIFRCVGKDPTRGYLSWRPTKTSQPNFHVPSAFGEFHFTK